MQSISEWRRSRTALRQGLQRSLIVAAATWLAACGGGSSNGGDATSPPPAPVVLTGPLGDPVTQTIGAAGGAVEATTLGVKVRVSFPAGALARDTAVKITPQTPAAGDWVALKLEPAGVFFAKPVTVVLELPAAVVPGAAASLRQRLGGADNYAATTVDATARTLTTRFLTFGGAALDVLARPAGVGRGRALALNVKAQADPGVPADNLISAQPNAPLADMIASIRRQVTILENVGDFEAAFALQANIASLLNRRDDVDFAVTATPFLRDAHSTACLALSAAVAEAKVARPETVAEFKPVREKLGNWWVITDQTDIDGVGCSVDLADFTAAALDLTRRELDLQAIEMRKIKTAPDPVKQQKLEEAAAAAKIARRYKIEVEMLHDAAANLDLPPLTPQQGDRARAAGVRPLAVRDSGYAAIIQTELLDPLVAPAREAAWGMATSTNSLAQYPVLIDAFGPTPALQQDAQYVRTSISIVSRNSAGNIMSTTAMGVTPGSDVPVPPVRTATAQVSKGDSLQLSGSIAQLECTTAVNETLKVSFEGVEVGSFNGSGGMLANGAVDTFTPEALLAAAGLPSTDEGVHPLVVRRSGSACAAALGITDEVLATVALDFGAGPLKVTVDFAGFNVWDYDANGVPIGVRAVNLVTGQPLLPYSVSTNGCCDSLSSTITLRKRDLNTVEFSVDFDFPGGLKAALISSSAKVRVKFQRAGTVTIAAIREWFANPLSCDGGSPQMQIAAANNIDFNNGEAAAVNQCGSAVYPDSTSFAVAAGSEWFFSVQVLRAGLIPPERGPLPGPMTGTGTAMTLHFEPTP